MIYRQVTRLFFYSFLFFAGACSTPKKVQEEVPVVKNIVAPMPVPVKNNLGTAAIPGPDDLFFEKLFKMDPLAFDKADGNIRIIYTEINKKGNGKIKFSDRYFNRSEKYFYPASAIKLPLALLTLQKINELKSKGIFKNTTMLTGAAYKGQTEVYNDPNTPNGKPSVEQYIKRALLVNDNDACNRLYEFLGPDYINTELQRLGYGHTEIIQRLGVNLTEDENRHTNPIVFYDSLNRIVYSQAPQYYKRKNVQRNDSIGNAYISEGKLIKHPMNMSAKNKFSLEDMHKMIANLINPGMYDGIKPFAITEDDRMFIIKLTGMDPGEFVWPNYAGAYYNGFTKYLYYGGEKYRGKALQSFNTSGLAYGQITDAAYFKDEEKNVEFIITCTKYCNKDSVINDDKYDYNKSCMPFFKNLGKAGYEYETENMKGKKK